MFDVNKIIENIKKLEVTEDFENDIICAFEDVEGEVMVSKSNNHLYQAYENKENSPIILIEVQNNKVVDVTEGCF